MRDPFDTEGRRAAVLAAWNESPTRFREDANAEEDLVLGGYADRLLIELLQNAADAASRDGVAGAVQVRLTDAELRVANTGAPLDPAGVDGLTSLRASAKRAETDSAGRFGVGFSAVLAVSDAPSVLSRHGGVAFSASSTRECLQGRALAEAGRRGGRVPVLRLVWPASDPPAEGYDTEVVLPLRDGAAAAAVRGALEAFDPALLLGFPALSTVDLGGRVIARVETGDAIAIDGVTWRVVSANGTVPAELLADRGVEERGRDTWSVLAAVPSEPLPVPQVVHAPTPSDEPLSLPVRLVASFPLSPDRRRIPDGALTSFLAARCGAAIAEVIASTAADPGVLSLVPRPSLAVGSVDAEICAAVVAELRSRAWLPRTGSPERARPSRLVAVDDGLVQPLAELLEGVLPAGWWTHRTAPSLAALGVRRLDLADVVDAVSAADRPPAWWRSLYDGLSGVSGSDLDALAALRVPLADGSTVTGPRGLLLPSDGLPSEAVATLGLRVVHPDAAHPLLERLGAREATPASVLADPRVRAEVRESLEADEPGEIADAVLALVSTVDDAPSWLADLALLGADGEWWAAGELMIPGSPLAAAVGEEAPFGTVASEVIDRWGAEVLVRVGVLRSFAVLDETDVDLADVDEFALEDAAGWLAALDPDVVRIERLRAVRDLEWVQAWDRALPMIAELGDVMTAPCFGITPEGRRVEVPSYTRWWLASRPILSGRRPGELRVPQASDLAGLYDEVSTVDAGLAALLGCRRGLDEVLADPRAAADLLDRVGDPARSVVPEVLATLYPRLAVALDDVDVDPPDCVRVAPDLVVEAGKAVVLDAPWLLDRLGGRFGVPAGADPAAVADLLDVPLLSELS